MDSKSYSKKKPRVWRSDHNVFDSVLNQPVTTTENGFCKKETDSTVSKLPPDQKRKALVKKTNLKQNTPQKSLLQKKMGLKRGKLIGVQHQLRKEHLRKDIEMTWEERMNFLLPKMRIGVPKADLYKVSESYEEIYSTEPGKDDFIGKQIIEEKTPKKSTEKVNSTPKKRKQDKENQPLNSTAIFVTPHASYTAPDVSSIHLADDTIKIRRLDGTPPHCAVRSENFVKKSHLTSTPKCSLGQFEIDLSSIQTSFQDDELDIHNSTVVNSMEIVPLHDSIELPDQINADHILTYNKDNCQNKLSKCQTTTKNKKEKKTKTATTVSDVLKRHGELFKFKSKVSEVLKIKDKWKKIENDDICINNDEKCLQNMNTDKEDFVHFSKVTDRRKETGQIDRNNSEMCSENVNAEKDFVSSVKVKNKETKKACDQVDSDKNSKCLHNVNSKSAFSEVLVEDVTYKKRNIFRESTEYEEVENSLTTTTDRHETYSGREKQVEISPGEKHNQIVSRGQHTGFMTSREDETEVKTFRGKEQKQVTAGEKHILQWSKKERENKEMPRKETYKQEFIEEEEYQLETPKRGQPTVSKEKQIRLKTNDNEKHRLKISQKQQKILSERQDSLDTRGNKSKVSSHSPIILSLKYSKTSDKFCELELSNHSSVQILDSLLKQGESQTSQENDDSLIQKTSGVIIASDSEMEELDQHQVQRKHGIQKSVRDIVEPKIYQKLEMDKGELSSNRNIESVDKSLNIPDTGNKVDRRCTDQENSMLEDESHFIDVIPEEVETDDEGVEIQEKYSNICSETIHKHASIKLDDISKKKSQKFTSTCVTPKQVLFNSSCRLFHMNTGIETPYKNQRKAIKGKQIQEDVLTVWHRFLQNHAPIQGHTYHAVNISLVENGNDTFYVTFVLNMKKAVFSFS